jgi:hypothetical protein
MLGVCFFKYLKLKTEEFYWEGDGRAYAFDFPIWKSGEYDCIHFGDFQGNGRNRSNFFRK